MVCNRITVMNVADHILVSAIRTFKPVAIGFPEPVSLRGCTVDRCTFMFSVKGRAVHLAVFHAYALYAISAPRVHRLLRLPSDSTSRWAPLPFANDSLSNTPVQNFHLKEQRHVCRTKMSAPLIQRDAHSKSAEQAVRKGYYLAIFKIGVFCEPAI